MSLLDYAKASGAKPRKVPLLERLTEDILDEIVEARQAGIPWTAVSESLEAVHGIKAAPSTLSNRVPRVRPSAR